VTAAGARVILLHGLGRTRRSMARLARALDRAGFRPQCWSYPSRAYALLPQIAAIRSRIEALAADGTPIHFVGHSLGAILLRGALAQPAGRFSDSRLVMIAPPNQGARLAARLLPLPGSGWFFGPALVDLAEGSAALATLAPPGVSTGIIAGTRRFSPVNPGSWLSLLYDDRPGDGTVALEETRLGPPAESVTVLAEHTFISSHPETRRQTLAFLREGHFAA
jgi:triacylglycerol lipase